MLPPLVVRALRRFGAGTIRFSRAYPSWDEASAAATGYDQPSILRKVSEASLKVKRGEAVYERDSVLFDRIEYSWPEALVYAPYVELLETMLALIGAPVFQGAPESAGAALLATGKRTVARALGLRARSLHRKVTQRK